MDNEQKANFLYAGYLHNTTKTPNLGNAYTSFGYETKKGGGIRIFNIFSR